MLLATLLAGAVLGGVVGWRLMAPETEIARAPEVVAVAPAPPPVVESAPSPAPPPAAAAVDDAAATANAAALPRAVVSPAPRARPPERPPAREAKERATRETPPRPVAAAATTGVVQLAITPWGQVEIDGKTAGVTPPLSKLTLSVGEHVITVRNEDFAPHTVTVRISADQPVTVRHRFGS
jgi:serine/threonine-protein kinase